jgi:uncharacterized damage-inducible protein DinB
MAVENIIASWKEVRSGLIDEVAQIPDDKFSFQAAAETRSVAQILQHLIESQKFLIGEACRPDTNLFRQPFHDQIRHYAPGVSEVNDKDDLLNLLSTSMADGETQLLAAGDELRNRMKRFDGQEMSKLAFLSFAIAHEMYHRGQLTVYERLLNIEPVLTRRFRKVFGEPPPAASSAGS